MGLLKKLAILNPATSAIGAKKFLFGQKGESPDYIHPELAAGNEYYALAANKLKLANIGTYSNQANQIGKQLNELGNLRSPEVLAQEQTNQEIERRRRSMGIGQESQNRNLSRGIAKRGLGASAAGLFAQANQAKDYQNELGDLESSRFGMQEGLRQSNLSEQMGRRSTLLNQLAGIQGQVQMPGTQYMTGGSEGTKGALPGVLGAVGGIFGGMFGGPAGAKGGSEAGSAIGEAGVEMKNGRKVTKYGGGYSTESPFELWNKNRNG